jgi:Na+-translocating ferredoxin:NAD+ oxidoreductase RnfG subunit
VLDDEQAAAIEAQARVKLGTRIWTIHEARRGDTPLGSAVIDVHNVRTLPQALLVVLTPAGALRSVRVLAFHEPSEYQATPRWLSQLEGRTLGPELSLQRDIHALAGATLTSQAVLRSVRTVLALHRVLAAHTPDAAGR